MTAIDDDVYNSPNETRIVAKAVVVDLKTLVQTNLCSICNVSFSIEIDQLIDSTIVWNLLIIDNFILLLHDNLNIWLQHFSNTFCLLIVSL